MESIWSKTVQIPERQPGLRQEGPQRGALWEDRQAEVAVIGAGLAGLLTAYYLQKRGKEVIVLEAAKIGSGQTKDTTAKITSQHGCIYASLTARYGQKRAHAYAEANEAAIAEYARLIQEEHIACHFQRVNSYLYSVEDEGELRQEAQAAAALGISACFTRKTDLPFPVKGAVCFENQAQFHPLEFLFKLAEGITIYENTEALRVKGNCIVARAAGQHAEKQVKIHAKQIVFATHYPFPNVPGFYFLRQHQERSYVIAISGIPKWEGMYYSQDKEGLSFRWFEDMLLVGGGGHRTGEAAGECGYAALERQLHAIYPRYEERARWAAQDCMPHDGIPFIGKFSCLHPNWYVATGFQKWGMTGSMISARLICDMICGQSNGESALWGDFLSYKKLFSPQRCHFWAAKAKLWEDVKVSAAGLARGHFRKDAVKCPHLGCELKWNPQEKSWDCPCHGSRFDAKGRLLDNPSQTSAKVPEADKSAFREGKDV